MLGNSEQLDWVDFSIEVELELSWMQWCEWIGFVWKIRLRHGSQEDGCVGPQTHLPRETQAVEEEFSESELVLLEGLGGFDAGTDPFE